MFDYSNLSRMEFLEQRVEFYLDHMAGCWCFICGTAWNLENDYWKKEMKCFGMCFCWSTHSLAYKSIIKINIEFERCMDFLVWMIDKYGEEVLQELEEEKQNKEEKTA